MILIDDRVGSRELSPWLPHDLHKVVRLESGDASFVGNGPDGPVTIGVERKTVLDFVSSLRDNRLLAVQMPKMFDHFQFIYVVIEGTWLINGQGEILTYPKTPVKMLNSNLDGVVNTLQVMTRVMLRHTWDIRHTATLIINLWKWWQKPWDDHHSMEAHANPAPNVQMVAPSLLRRLAKEFPGIGWRRSKSVEQHFGTVQAMLNAPLGEWLKIKGVGKKIAEQTYKEIHGD